MARKNKNRGSGAGRQTTMPRRQRQSAGGARAQNSTGVRTVSVSVVASNLVSADDSNVWDIPIQGSRFPGLAAHLDHAIEWRIRSARVSFTSVKSTDGYSLAAIVTPVGATWKPKDWVAIETSGGVIKPVKNSGWSSNNLGSQDSWFNHANPAAVYYTQALGGPKVAESVGVATLHATIQLRGNR